MTQEITYDEQCDLLLAQSAPNPFGFPLKPILCHGLRRAEVALQEVKAVLAAKNLQRQINSLTLLATQLVNLSSEEKLPAIASECLALLAKEDRHLAIFMQEREPRGKILFVKTASGEVKTLLWHLVDLLAEKKRELACLAQRHSLLNLAYVDPESN